ncbi:hypothetical protein [Vibrio sp. Isolate24]|nr:hypothetical protein [Vibrio sp. Isolate24]
MPDCYYRSEFNVSCAMTAGTLTSRILGDKLTDEELEAQQA